MRFLNDWLLTILLLLPAMGGAAVPFVRPARAARQTAIGVALATCCLSLLILIPFHRQQGAAYEYAPAGTVQMLRAVEVFPVLHAGYRVAVDGLSFPFVVLTTFLCAILAAVSPRGMARPRLYLLMLLWLEAATLGVFLSFDLLLLCTFLQFMLVPCFALIWLTAGEQRARATIAFLVPMLVAMACLFVATMGERLISTHCLTGGTLDLVRLAACRAGWGERTLFALALIGFVIRLPVVPFHSWLSIVAADASPPAAAAIGVLVPLTGGYGLFRVVLPLFPTASASLWWVIAGLGLLTVFYLALAAIGQRRLGRAVVNVNVAMAGFVLVGAATLTPAGANGAVFVLLAGGMAAMLMLLLAGGPRDAQVPAIPSRSGSGWVASFAMGTFTLVAFPVFLGQVMVLFGAFESAERDSIVVRLRAATPALAMAVAVAICVGILLFGVACVQMMRSLMRSARLNPSAQPTEESTFNVAVLVPVAAMIVLLGAFAAPLCFAFTRRAIGAWMSMPP